jgi:TM2 domain-containing membrane protein YozV
MSLSSEVYVSVETSEMHLSLLPSPFGDCDGDPRAYIVANGSIVGSIQLRWGWSGERQVLRRAWIDCSPSVPDHLQLFLLSLAVTRGSVGALVRPFQQLFGMLSHWRNSRSQPGKLIDDTTFKCACERCGGHLEVSVESAGSVVECPHCHESTSLRPDDPAQGGSRFADQVATPQTHPELAAGLLGTSPEPGVSPTNPAGKSWLKTFLLSLFLGGLGIDRFYNGRTGLGIGKLLTGGACGLWSLIDVLLLLFKKYQDAQGNTLQPAKRSHMVTALSILGAVVLFNVILVGAAVQSLKSGLTGMESEFVAGYDNLDLSEPLDAPIEGWNERSTSAGDVSAAPSAVINHALSLDGRESWAELPTDVFGDLTEATVECWVKWDRFQNYSRAFDFVIGDRLVSAMNRGTNPDLWVETFVAGNRRSIQGTALLRLGQWTHLAVAVGPDQLAVYVNGRPLSQKFTEEPDAFRSADYTRQNLLGRSNARKAWADNEDLDGRLDEIRVWNGIRTPDEVKAGVNARLRGDEPNLIGRWSFDDPGNPGRVLSPGRHDAKLIGNATTVATAESEILGDFLLGCAETDYRNGNMKQARRLAQQAAAEPLPPPALAKARILLELIEPPVPIELSRFAGREIYLSDGAWSEAKVGWGRPVRNGFFLRDPLNPENPLFLELAGTIYQKGLYAHAPSRYAFRLNGEWTRFEAIAGLQTGAFPEIAGVFVLKGDGRELYRSQPLVASVAQPIHIDVEGVDLLELIVEPGQPSTKRCWTIWCDPRIHR